MQIKIAVNMIFFFYTGNDKMKVHVQYPTTGIFGSLR